MAVVQFSDALRARTRSVHTQTEGATFITDLMDGKLTKADYIALLEQLYFVYQALERVADVVANDSIASRFITPQLTRLPAIAADLDFLVGAGWHDRLQPLPATSRYVARINEMSAWPNGFIAHHYTRYLGDLSGGQAIRSILQSKYGFETNGVGFYIFSQIAKPKVFRDTYREQLDSVRWSTHEQERVIAEVIHAFQLNAALFDDLGKVVAKRAA